jgi:predicted nucleic acid-binding protein
VVIDASVWVSYFMPQETRHAKTVAWLDQVTRGEERLIVPTLLLPELAGAIARRTGATLLALQAARQVARWPALELVPQDDALIALATQIAAELSLRGADAIYVAAAKQRDRPLVTWDVEQQQRGRRVVATRPPGDDPAGAA